MSNRGVKPPKPKKLPRVEPKTKTRIPLLATVLGTATLIGGIAALLVFLPRMTVTTSDPADPDDPFTASATIVNTGFMPLKSVEVSVGMGQMVTTGGAPADPNFHPIYWPHLHRNGWSVANLRMDDRYTIALNDVLGTEQRGGLDYADIAVVVDYEIPLIGLKREKVFPLFAHRQTNGKFYWYSKTVDEKPY